MIRLYGSAKWNEELKKFLQSIETLQAKYAQERQERKIPIDISNTIQVNLSPGGQNELVKKIIYDMFPNFAPEGTIIYLGDTFVYFDRKALEMVWILKTTVKCQMWSFIIRKKIGCCLLKL